MNGKNHRQAFPNFFQCFKDSAESFHVINIWWTVQRQDRVLLVCQSLPFFDGWLTCKGKILQHWIDHNVADKADALGGDSLAKQISVCVFWRCEQKIRNLICQQPIDFFWHCAIVTAQAGELERLVINQNQHAVVGCEQGFDAGFRISWVACGFHVVL